MAKDFYHDNARLALEKDGWKITDDPFLVYDPFKNEIVKWIK